MLDFLQNQIDIFENKNKLINENKINNQRIKEKRKVTTIISGKRKLILIKKLI